MVAPKREHALGRAYNSLVDNHMREQSSGSFRPSLSRREFVSAVGAAGLIPMVSAWSERLPLSGDDPSRLFRVRAITAGVAPRSLSDVERIESALAMLERAKRRLQDAGYVVQTV